MEEESTYYYYEDYDVPEVDARKDLLNLADLRIQSDLLEFIKFL